VLHDIHVNFFGKNLFFAFTVLAIVDNFKGIVKWQGTNKKV